MQTLDRCLLLSLGQHEFPLMPDLAQGTCKLIGRRFIFRHFCHKNYASLNSRSSVPLHNYFLAYSLWGQRKKSCRQVKGASLVF
jgi:hypothetical protein